MRYISIAFLTQKQTGTDVLGNPVMETETGAKWYRGRFTEWSAEETALEGRDLTKAARRLLTDAPLSVCRTADGVQTDGGENYRILSVKELERWRLLYVERWRV